jgi:hypothetical protein
LCERFASHKECGTGQIIVLTDPKAGKVEYRAQNPQGKTWCRITLDSGYLNQSMGKICDYILLICAENLAFLVELKGSDLGQAIAQIANALTILEPELKNCQVHGRIVLSKAPVPSAKNTDSNFVRLRKRLKKLGGTLDYQSRRYDRDGF